MARRSGLAVWMLFLANLGIAVVAAFPVYRGIFGFTSHSLMAGELANGFSVDWLTDFSHNSPGSLERYARIIGWFALLSLPVNSVLAGGVLARFRAPEIESALGNFFREVARYAWRLVRLTIIGLVCYWLIFRLLNQSLSDWVNNRMRDWLDDRPVFWIRLAVTALVLAGLGFVNMVMDYARVKLVMDEGSGAAEAFLASLRFAIRRFWSAVPVYALPSLCGLALLGVYNLSVPWNLVHSPLAVGFLFIGQQVVMLGRYWFRVATWASEWAYYSGWK